MTGLSSGEIRRVVNQYIGVEAGYLGNFSYRTHADFYLEFCDLYIDPYELDGTTRERFIKILSAQSPGDQAKILRGVLNKFPEHAPDAPRSRNQTEVNFIEGLVARLTETDLLGDWSPAIASETVELAISNARTLIDAEGPASAVDRIHTALHGFLKNVCKRSDIEFQKNDSITRLLKHLKEHKVLAEQDKSDGPLEAVLHSFGNVLHTLNLIRNDKSLAHANTLLDGADAQLAINAAVTIMRYLDEKLAEEKSGKFSLDF